MQKPIQKILSELPDNVTMVAVSKLHTKEEIDAAYAQGCRIFGESKAQELKAKHDPKYQWHMIGHLQRNKVKDVVPLVDMIQSVDSLRLVQEIEKQCAKINKTMPILIEVNISQEINKSGISPQECLDLIEECKQYPHLDVEGLMCIGPLCENEEHIKKCFLDMTQLFQMAQKRYGADRIKHLSMGMSDDYKLAIACGSNMVRLGSILFGERNYQK